MSKPARLSKLTKVFVVSLKYVPSKSDADTERLISQSQSLSRHGRKVPVAGDEVESISKAIYIQIKISQAAILFGELTHLSSHLSVASYPAH